MNGDGDRPDPPLIEDILARLHKITPATPIIESTTLGEYEGRTFALVVLLGDEDQVTGALHVCDEAIDAVRQCRVCGLASPGSWAGRDLCHSCAP